MCHKLIYFFQLLNFATLLLAAHDGYCDKNFFYHQTYGYGYDIKCEKLNNQTFSELSSATVFNEIRLTIKSSSLRSVRWQISSNLPRLREIRIVNSTIIGSDLFEKLYDLRVLNITNSTVNNNSYVGVGGLLNLNKLILNRNYLSYITFNRTVYNLENLDLDNNNFVNVKNISPCLFPYLQILSMRNNKLSEINNTTCLQNLLTLNLDFNHIDRISLNLPTLTTLSLSYNKLKTFKYSIGNLPKLEHLNLEGNNLDTLHTGIFRQFANLKCLNLKNNRLISITDNLFAYDNKIEILNLDNNKIMKINLHTSFLTELSICNNQLKSLDFITNLKSMKKLHLSNNKIVAVPNRIFENLTSLVFLNLSFNKIHENLFKESLYGLKNLMRLDLSNAGIKQIKPNDYLSNLRTLNVSYNHLTDFAIFQNLTSLEILNVSYNNIDTIQAKTIKNLEFLRTIDLEGNRLKNIEYVQVLDNLPSLQVINIRNNSLPCEFLDEMIGYFKNNSVNFTVDGKLNYDRENVAGIYCKQKSMVVINTQNVSSSKQVANKREESAKNNTSVIMLSLAGVFAVLLIIAYALRLHFKRMHYVHDTVQLLDR